jgi:hypothetical protein
MTNEILERIAALEADVSQLKQNSITRQDIGQMTIAPSRPWLPQARLTNFTTNPISEGFCSVVAAEAGNLNGSPSR